MKHLKCGWPLSRSILQYTCPRKGRLGPWPGVWGYALVDIITWLCGFWRWMTPTNCMCRRHSPTTEVISVTTRFIRPPHRSHPKFTFMVTNDRPAFLSFHVNQPSHSWHKAISRAGSHSLPRIKLVCFLLVSHQSGQQFLRYRYSKYGLENKNMTKCVGEAKVRGKIVDTEIWKLEKNR